MIPEDVKAAIEKALSEIGQMGPLPGPPREFPPLDMRDDPSVEGHVFRQEIVWDYVVIGYRSVTVPKPLEYFAINFEAPPKEP